MYLWLYVSPSLHSSRLPCPCASLLKPEGTLQVNQRGRSANLLSGRPVPWIPRPQEKWKWRRMWEEENLEFIRGVKKNSNTQKTAEKPDYKQWKKDVAAVIPPVCSAVDLEQQSGTIWVPSQYLFWPVGVIVVQLTELQLRDRQLRFITLP